MKRNYEDEAQHLIEAIDIAIEVFTTPPLTGQLPDHAPQMAAAYKGFRYELINAAPQYQNLASLKYSIEEVFTYFQEGSGPVVNFFWQQIKAANLPYTRKNKLEKILKRGKINNQIEYDYVVDTVVPLEQEGMITADEAALLKQYIGNFESRKKK